MWEVRVLLVAVAVAFTATAVCKLASSRIVNRLRMKRAVIRGGRALQAVSVDIPEEIIFCILMYLPVKSLLRFKTVSKSWNAFITNPYFVREHHLKQPSSKLLLVKRRKKEGIDDTCIFPMPLSFDTNLCAHPNVYQPVKPYLSGEYSIVGPCFGVHCFGMCSQRSVKIELCNIATRETKVCPYLSFVVDRVLSWTFGFGCIHNDITSVSEFKVVALIKYTRGGRLNCSTHVYSSAINSWKSTESCQSSTYGKGTEVNGVIHWLAKSLDAKSDDNMFILTFDLQKEVFGRMELPQVAYSALLTKQDDQHLSLIAVTSDYLVDIWVMHVQGSWVRQAVVGKLKVSSTNLLGYWHSVGGLLWKANSVEVDGIVMAIGGNCYKFCVEEEDGRDGMGDTGMLQAASDQIPNDIIFCILMYLPVKSLLRFKTVSKSWNALITNPCFVREHHSRQLLSKLLLVERREQDGMRIFPVPLSFDTTAKTLCAHPNVYQPVKSYLADRDSAISIGTCFGVFCFGVWNNRRRTYKIKLCNIATGEIKVCHNLNSGKDTLFKYAFGFGCVHNDIISIPEFKVVTMEYYVRDFGLNCSTY